MRNFKILEKSGVFLKFVETENGLYLNSIASGGDLPNNDIGFLPFICCAAGVTCGSTGADSAVYKVFIGEFRQTDFVENENLLRIKYRSDKLSCETETEYRFLGGGVFTCQTKITATKDIFLTDFFNLFPITEFREEYNRKFTLKHCINTWQGEGQWYENNLNDLGFHDYCNHYTVSKFKTENFGSQTTGLYYPAMCVSDKETREAWYMESEPAGSWFCELSVYKLWDAETGTLILAEGSVTETNGSIIALKKGDSFQTNLALFYVNNGNSPFFENLYRAKRKCCGYFVKEPTLFFNDYMNCLWSSPNWKDDTALIDAAAELGAEYYIIDAGWYNYKNEPGNRFGDWNFDGDVFGENGLDGIVAYIQSKGMKAGLWLEGEVVGENSKVFKSHPDWFLTVQGKIYGNERRKFLDFRKEEVRNFLENVFDRFYALGIRFVKIDYNDKYIWVDGKRYGERNGLIENHKAVTEFYAAIKKKYPDMVLENCASGGRRQDNGTLKHFDLQSVSDQENYLKYPSIICGSLVHNPPEKIGTWCMPFPVRGCDRTKSKDELLPLSDEGVIYNCVNALTSIIYLSSRIDYLDKKKLLIVKEAISLYREIYSDVLHSYPEFPLGITRIEDKKHALVYKNARADYLYLWANGEKDFIIEGAESYCQIFPAKSDCIIQGNKIILPDNFSARLFRKKN